MLLTQVHIFIEVRQHRSMQYKYRGYICNFAVNTAKEFNQLPLLLKHLNIIILKPLPSLNNNPNVVN